jgi:hypothetical protein
VDLRLLRFDGSDSEQKDSRQYAAKDKNRAHTQYRDGYQRRKFFHRSLPPKRVVLSNES